MKRIFNYVIVRCDEYEDMRRRLERAEVRANAVAAGFRRETIAPPPGQKGVAKLGVLLGALGMARMLTGTREVP